jgi:hypothetical protein
VVDRTAAEPEGGELLLQEIRDEGSRLVHHPIQEFGRLEKVAEEGESAATPLIVMVGIGVVVTVLFLIFGALAMGAYYLF